MSADESISDPAAGGPPADEPPVTPWPLPPGAREVVIVGGSFDPPHRGHVRVPERVRRAVAPAGWLLYVPAGVSPFKVGQGGADAADRLAMLRLAIGAAGLERAEIWTDEVDRYREGGEGGEPSYMVQTLMRAMGVAEEGTTFRLMLGADQAVALHRWKDFRRVVQLAEPVVVLRPPLGTVSALVSAMRETGAWAEGELLQWARRVAMSDLDTTSSTEIRGKVAGRSAVGVEGLDEAVAGYIDERGLYGAVGGGAGMAG